jgi:CheY-like chemotaxis protein
VNTTQPHILLVEDDPELRSVLAALLSYEGYQVRTSEDGVSALVAMESNLPDVIISDLNMPRMSGFEFLSTVRHNFPSIPLVAMSGAFSGKQTPPGVEADAFYEKASHPVFLTRILRTISVHRPRHPEVA